MLYFSMKFMLTESQEVNKKRLKRTSIRKDSNKIFLKEIPSIITAVWWFQLTSLIQHNIYAEAFWSSFDHILLAVHEGSPETYIVGHRSRHDAVHDHRRHWVLEVGVEGPSHACPRSAVLTGRGQVGELKTTRAVWCSGGSQVMNSYYFEINYTYLQK